MARLRTLKNAVAEIKAKDPKSDFNLHLLRKLIAQGIMPVIRSGKKQFVDMDILENYISTDHGTPVEKSVSGIRLVGTNQSNAQDKGYNQQA
jgi:hypothetical protein